MAELDDLKEIWNAQEGVAVSRLKANEMQFLNRSNRLRSKIFVRDRLEGVVAGVMAVPLLIGLFFTGSSLEWWGMLTLLIACCAIPLVLWWGRAQANISPEHSFVESLDREIEFLQRQMSLLSRVHWWYLLPIYAGIALISLGIGGLNIGVAFYLLITALLFELLRLVNVATAEDFLWPMLKHYRKMRETLDLDPAGDELGEDKLALEARLLVDVDRPAGRHWKAIVTVGAAAISIVLMGELVGDFYDATTALWLMGIGLTILLLLAVGVTHVRRIAKRLDAAEGNDR